MNSVKESIYWVGPRESDILDCKHLFVGSITTFGSSTKEAGYINIAMCDSNSINRIDCNNPNSNATSDIFMKEEIEKIINSDPDSRFCLYNGNAFTFISRRRDFRDFFLKNRIRFICLNDEDLMINLNKKTYFHNDIKKALNGTVEFIDTRNALKVNSTYADICDLFGWDFGTERDNKTRFIFQASVASGGSGTFVLDSDPKTRERIDEYLDKGAEYLFSKYYENNVSVNIHAIIYKDDILLSPGSIQLMKFDLDRLLYRGADFVAYRSIDEKIKKSFEQDSLKICKVLQEKGYRGVCGIDAIIYEGKVQIIEVNNRFQASTYLINKALIANNMRTIQEMNMDAFNAEISKPCKDDKKLQTLEVNYSNYAYIFNDTLDHPNHILNTYKNEEHVASAQFDGYTSKVAPTANLAQLFKLTFDTNISWINEEGTLFIHENVSEPLKEVRLNIKNYIANNTLIYFKTALMVYGVVLSDSVTKEMVESGGIRPGNNNSVDIKLYDVIPGMAEGDKNNYLVVNAPRGTKFAKLSPFTIKHVESNGKRIKALFYYDTQMTFSDMLIYPIDPFSYKKTKAHGIPYSEIAYLSTDRVRIHITNKCVYKLAKQECKFCDIQMSCGDIPMEDIEEVIVDYIKNFDKTYPEEQYGRVRHFLIGGQSAEDELAKEKILKIIDIIRDNDNRDRRIYAMVLPYDIEQIEKMSKAGLDELGCNIEIFDQELAKKYMPGKGLIDRNRYFKVLDYATGLPGLDEVGNVRSMVLLGLEPKKSLIKGIRMLAERGIQPFISVFRPLPETSLVDLVPPPLKYVIDVYFEAEKICGEYGLKLGPECVYCQNNTLSLPYFCIK